MPDLYVNGKRVGSMSDAPRVLADALWNNWTIEFREEGGWVSGTFTPAPVVPWDTTISRAELERRKNEPGPILTADEKVDSGQTHFENFIECVRSRKSENLRAPLEEGHFSTTLCHLGNISYRLRRSVTFDGATERFVGDEEANKLLTRTYRAPYSLPDKT